jgi:flagellar protein FliS
MSFEARDAYLESKILSADPLELIRILYQAALEAVAEARRCLAEGDIPGRSRQISRAHGILTELALSINHEAGGALSRSLAELYDYMQRRLIEAHLNQSDPPLSEVAGLLGTLLEGWRQCRPEAEPLGPAVGTPCPAPASEYVAQSWSG